MHTSTITVAVLQVPEEGEFTIRESDIDIRAIRGSGDGGQKKNTTSSCIVATHRPSNLRVRIETERSQHQNKVLAIGMLEAKLRQLISAGHADKINHIRRNHVGTGMRGDKRRTIRCQHGVAEDHITGQTWRLDDYMAGKI